MSAPSPVLAQAIDDLKALLVELRAKDDELVLDGWLEPRSDEQAIRLGRQRPTLTLIRRGRDAE